MYIWRVSWLFFFLLNFSLVVVFEFPFTPICYPSVWNFQEVLEFSFKPNVLVILHI